MSTSARDGVRIMPFPVALHYESPVAPAIVRYGEGLVAGKILGQRCRQCQLIFVPPRDLCPIDVIPLDSGDDVELEAKGTVINFTVVTPVKYPGQHETEPFARVSIQLDGIGGTLQLQDLLEVAVEDVRSGMRVEAVWRPVEERSVEEAGHGGWGQTTAGIEGWMPTGDPDVDMSELSGRGF